MRSRGFGVEIECGVSSRHHNADEYHKRFEQRHGTGYDRYDDSFYDETYARMLVDDWCSRGLISAEWGELFGWDGTLIELRSPILKGPSGFKELRKVMNLLLDHGGYVTEEDGLHIHHDAPEFVRNQELVLALVESWYENNEHIYNLVHRDRVDGWASPAWHEHDVARLQEGSDYYNFGRKDLNINALRKHGSIEIRLHQGTLSFEEAEAWIRFGQAFINKIAAGKKAVVPTANTVELIQKLRVPQRVRPDLVKKMRVAA